MRAGWCAVLRAVIRPPLYRLHSLVCECNLGLPTPVEPMTATARP